MFHCQWLCRVSFTPFLPPRLPELTSQELLPEICWNTFLLKAVTGMLAWQASFFFSFNKFSVVEIFCSCCLNCVLRVWDCLALFLLQQNKDVVIDFFFFFFTFTIVLYPELGKIALCCCQTFNMAAKTPDSASSVELLVTVHQCHSVLETIWDDNQ